MYSSGKDRFASATKAIHKFTLKDINHLVNEVIFLIRRLEGSRTSEDRQHEGNCKSSTWESICWNEIQLQRCVVHGLGD